MLPLELPAAVGLNCVVRVRVCDGESVTGALPPVTEYPVPLTAICEIPTLELPVFVTATFCEVDDVPVVTNTDRKSTRLNSSHRCISYAVFCLKKKTTKVVTLRVKQNVVICPSSCTFCRSCHSQ